MSRDHANAFLRGRAVIALGAVCSASLIVLTCHNPHDVAIPSTEGRVALEVAARPAAPTASPTPAAPPATSLALLRRNIEQRVDQGPKHRLSKADLRPRMKVVMRLLDRCYNKALLTDPTISGVVNTGLTIRSDPTLGISLTATGFDTDGRLRSEEQTPELQSPTVTSHPVL